MKLAIILIKSCHKLKVYSVKNDGKKCFLTFLNNFNLIEIFHHLKKKKVLEVGRHIYNQERNLFIYR